MREENNQWDINFTIKETAVLLEQEKIWESLLATMTKA